MKMNMSEYVEKNSPKIDKGWICPKCGKVLAPTVTHCDCTSDQSKNENQTQRWFKD